MKAIGALVGMLAWLGACSPEEGAEVPTPREPDTVPWDAGNAVDDDVGQRPVLDAGTVANEDVAIDEGTPPVDVPTPPPIDAPPPDDRPAAMPVDVGNPTPPPVDSGPTLPPPRSCRVASTTFDAAPQELDGPPTAARMRFTVRGIPANAQGVTVRFDGHDLDHPGEEGFVYVGGQRAPLPANTAWDNVTTPDLTVAYPSLALPAGDVTVEFGPGPLSRSFFRISRVALDVAARVDACPGTIQPPPVDAGTTGPTGPLVVRSLRYDQATYTNRHNWVFRCDAGYAYTARGSDHLTTDCPRLYRPDGTLRGTATWRFTNVVRGNYDIEITSRHSANRNPNGALFTVNGEAVRIHQNDDRGGLNLFTDTWGRRSLGGDVLVVLNANTSTSDSVAVVTLRPVR